jgi:hypothetical protein
MLFKAIVKPLFKANVEPLAQEGWEVRFLDAHDQPLLDPQMGKPLPSRKLGIQGSQPDAFPLPPKGDPSDLPAGLGAADLSGAYYALMNQAAGSDGVLLFGMYLFNTLLGQAAWDAINHAAGPQEVELALHLAVGDTSLNRLPWETMHTGKVDSQRIYEGFLAADPQVAITRRVQGTASAQYALGQLPSPPKVLFVIGTNLSDEFIRPGAEYLGLLRNLENEAPRLHHRLLLNASTASLEEALLAFKPDVVHVICHGVASSDGVALEMRDSTDDAKAVSVNAEDLLTALQAKKKLSLPKVLVLNACSTATAEEVQTGRPLAAELVLKGIPVVLGMAGQVADQACRLFTRGFYEALLKGGGIGQAAALGRRAALAHGGYDPRGAVDWALPTLFLAEAVGEARLGIQVNSAELERITQAMEFTRQPAYPVFCGRLDFFELYERFMKGSKAQFVFISVPRPDRTDPKRELPHYGGARLLQELAAQALRDGHVPILLEKKWLGVVPGSMGEVRWPAGFKEFLKLFIKATRKTLEVLIGMSCHKKLDEWDWKILPPFLENYPGAVPAKDLPPGLPTEFMKYGLEEIEKLAKAFRLDLLSLLDQVAAQRGAPDSSEIKLLLLIDDAHQLIYSQEFFALLGKDGLENDSIKGRARSVITYSSKPIENQENTVELIKDQANAVNVITIELKPLHEEIDPEQPAKDPEKFRQASLVYKHFLLHWKYKDQPKPLALASSKSNELESVISILAELVNGIPSYLCSSGVSIAINTSYRNLCKLQVIRIADDEDALTGLAAIRKRA